ncbi:MAG: hypothetical protein K2Q25_13730 [Mycobacteriaceae bacterium]|nr:hypothetical protein [Mycobacteriaceae bacterium]
MLVGRTTVIDAAIRLVTTTLGALGDNAAFPVAGDAYYNKAASLRPLAKTLRTLTNGLPFSGDTATLLAGEDELLAQYIGHLGDWIALAGKEIDNQSRLVWGARTDLEHVLGRLQEQKEVVVGLLLAGQQAESNTLQNSAAQSAGTTVVAVTSTVTKTSAANAVVMTGYHEELTALLAKLSVTSASAISPALIPKKLTVDPEGLSAKAVAYATCGADLLNVARRYERVNVPGLVAATHGVLYTGEFNAALTVFDQGSTTVLQVLGRQVWQRFHNLSAAAKLFLSRDAAAAASIR